MAKIRLLETVSQWININYETSKGLHFKLKNMKTGWVCGRTCVKNVLRSRVQSPLPNRFSHECKNTIKTPKITMISLETLEKTSQNNLECHTCSEIISINKCSTVILWTLSQKCLWAKNAKQSPEFRFKVLYQEDKWSPVMD